MKKICVIVLSAAGNEADFRDIWALRGKSCC